MRRTPRARGAVTAVLAAVTAVVLTAGGCGATGTGTGSGPGIPDDPGTGPFTKVRVRADLDASAVDAGAPPNDPRWVAMEKSAEAAGSPAACAVQYRSFGTPGERLDVRRYEAVLGELGERGWRRSGERQQRTAPDGTVGEASQTFTKRGWSLVAQYWGVPETGHIGLVATEDACVRRSGPGQALGAPRTIGERFPYAKLLP
ncbi:hypothetical protein ACFY7C_12500 [Streptomyces sp. NPDC012769]|uniref:hypothetical protein n=1 Tax=Streptomyces sp. NPDC012769 TaxID=3364848 RepID=UPI0036BD4636